jgi:hypothetical protein
MMDQQPTGRDFGRRLNAFAGQTGLAVAVLLYPLIFQAIFSTGPLRAGEWQALTTTSITLGAIAVLFLLFRRRILPGLSLMFFSLLVLVSLELLVRFGVKVFASPARITALKEQCNSTYADLAAYSGHPFTQFTGTPSVQLKGGNALEGSTPYNNFGFIGPDFHYEKAPGTIRVACLGESTTADGYPAFLESFLNKNGGGRRYEVMNFGHAYWTTNHSLVNFLLNVTDFHPDYIVIHHGWNEEKVRGYPPGEFRGDYSHAFKTFRQPSVPDRYLIRLSVAYRLAKFAIDPLPAWQTLGAAIQKPREPVDSAYADTSELRPFRRNLEDIITVALQRHIGVVLTTLPHSTDPSIAMYYSVRSIDQCNAVTRGVAHEFGTAILFVDLDSLLTGRHNEIFKDLGHVTDYGRTMKSEAIGKAILPEAAMTDTLQ